MNNWIIYLLIAIIIWFLFSSIEYFDTDLVSVVSHFDNKRYLVRKLPDKEQASALISKVRMNLEKLTDYLKERHPNDPRTKQISQRFNTDRIIETEGGSKYTSYSVNKGEKMVLCLRSRDGNDQLIDLNTLMFVALHEYTHILTKSVGHTDEFWNNFKWVLRIAIQLGIYQCEDYYNNPRKYCGIEINNSPITCASLN